MIERILSGAAAATLIITPGNAPASEIAHGERPATYQRASVQTGGVYDMRTIRVVDIGPSSIIAGKLDGSPFTIFDRLQTSWVLQSAGKCEINGYVENYPANIPAVRFPIKDSSCINNLSGYPGIIKRA